MIMDTSEQLKEWDLSDSKISQPPVFTKEDLDQELERMISCRGNKP